MPLAGIQTNGVARRAKPERGEALVSVLLEEEGWGAKFINLQDTSTVWIPDKNVRG